MKTRSPHVLPVGCDCRCQKQLAPVVFLMLLFSFCWFGRCQAQAPSTWTGLGGDNNWSNGSNWVGGVAPQGNPNTLNLVFDNPANRNVSNQDIASPFAFNRLTVDTTSDSFEFNGQPLQLSEILLEGDRQVTINNDLDSYAFNYANATSSAELVKNGDIAISHYITIGTNFTLNGNISSPDTIALRPGNLGIDFTATINGTVSSSKDFEMYGGATLNGTNVINTNFILHPNQHSDRNRLLSFRSNGTLTINGNIVANGPAEISAGNVEVNGNVSIGSSVNPGGLLTVSNAANFLGNGEITLQYDHSEFEVIGTVGSGHLITINGRTEIGGLGNPYELGTSLYGSGVIQGTTSLEGGIIRGNLTFDGPVNVNPNQLLQGFSGHNCWLGTNAIDTAVFDYDRSQLTINNQINFNGDIGTVGFSQVAGDFLGTGVFNINANAGAEFNGVNIGAGLTTNVAGTLFQSNWLNNSIFNGTVNLQGGKIDVRGTEFVGPIFTSGNSLISALFQDTFFNGPIVVQDGLLTSEGTVRGNGSITIEEGASIAGDFNLATVARGALTNFNSNKNLILEGGQMFGTSNLQDRLIVRTTETSNIGVNANVLVANLTEVQTGTLRIEDSAILRGAGRIEVANQAVLDVQGTVNKNVTVMAGSLLQGSGLVAGDILLQGTLTPGNSAGILDIDGDIDMAETTTVCVEIGGTAAGTKYDQIRGSGIGNSMARLRGMLDVQFLDGFAPSPSDEFFVFQNMAIAGRFDNTFGDILLTQQGQFNVQYGSSFVRLYAFVAVPEPSGAGLIGLIVVGCNGRRRRHV